MVMFSLQNKPFSNTQKGNKGILPQNTISVLIQVGYTICLDLLKSFLYFAFLTTFGACQLGIWIFCGLQSKMIQLVSSLKTSA